MVEVVPLERTGERNVKQLAARLLAWFEAHHRSLPWRLTTDPYRIWVSEIMLQQTRVETVIDYYERFLKAFPTVQDLAHAPLQEVLRVWQGLGYYSRARNLHNASRVVVEQLGGQLPDTYQGLLALPGIGPYTAGAIASIALGEPVVAVDGNVLRVGSRLFLVTGDAKSSVTRREVGEHFQGFMPPDRAGDFNQALMELGATVCTPRSPACGDCPVATLCEARSAGLEETLPVRSRSRSRSSQHLVALALWCDGRWLMRQRPIEGLLGGLWEFPLVTSPPGATDKQLVSLAEGTLHRELGIEAQFFPPSITLTHEFSHLTWNVTLLVGTLSTSQANSMATRCTANDVAVALESPSEYVAGNSSADEVGHGTWTTIDLVVDNVVDRLPQGTAQVKLLAEARNIAKQSGMHDWQG